MDLGYIISTIFVALLLGANYFTTGIYEYFYGYYPKGGSLFWMYIFHSLIVFSCCIVLTVNSLKENINVYNERKYLLLGIMTYSLSIVEVVGNYGKGFYPVGLIFYIPSIIFFSFAIFKDGIFNVSIFIRKTTLLIGVLVVYLALGIIGISFLQMKFGLLLGFYWWVVFSVVILVFMLSTYKLVSLLVQFKEEEFYHEKDEYHIKLRKYVEDITKSKTFNESATYIVRRISTLGKINFCAISRLNEEKLPNGKIKKYYEIVKVADRTGKFLKSLEKQRISVDSVLVNCLKNTRKYLEKRYIKYLIDNYRLTNAWYYFSLVKEMEELNCELVFPAIINDEVVGMLLLGSKMESKQYTKQDIELFEILTLQAAKSISEVISREENIKLILASCKTTLEALDCKDQYTRGHTERVKKYCRIMSKHKYISEQLSRIQEGIWGLELAAELHDIGKISIPENILNKKGNLISTEWQVMRSHPEKSVAIISPIAPWLKENIINGILQHHENYEGSGYPFGLKGKEIHFYARVIRVADAVDAMTSMRPYRESMSCEETLNELVRYKGICFDPTVVDAFLESCKSCMVNKNYDFNFPTKEVIPNM